MQVQPMMVTGDVIVLVLPEPLLCPLDQAIRSLQDLLFRVMEMRATLINLLTDSIVLGLKLAGILLRYLLQEEHITHLRLLHEAQLRRLLSPLTMLQIP